MNLVLTRQWLTPKSTMGMLSVNGVDECFTLEDRYRPPPEAKVPGETCIPCGTYGVTIDRSRRFGVDMPLVLEVPDFIGIRIHPGNTDKDTLGCILVGLMRGVDALIGSRVAYQLLFAKIRAAFEAGERIVLTVKLADSLEVC